MVVAVSDRPTEMTIYRTALPMRSFEHAAATRKVAEAIVVRLQTARGAVGWGEALPRPYVTGETLETVVDDLAELFWPALHACEDRNNAAETVAAMPTRHAGRVVTAARCAAELAAIQALDLPWWRLGKDQPDHDAGPLRAKGPTRTRVTGVLGSANPTKTAWRLRLMRWYGLRHFKLKLGFGPDIDRANLEAVSRQLASRLAIGTCTLRVDINGAWPPGQTIERVAQLAPMGVRAVEQPCQAGAGELAALAADCALPLIADESLLTGQDAEALLAAKGKVWLNIRIAKNGGLHPALGLVRAAAAAGVPYVLGCMVGESGILSTAQRALLAAAPAPVAVEGNYGRLLLADDLLRPSPRFGYGGWLRISGRRFAPAPRVGKLLRHAQRLRHLT